MTSFIHTPLGSVSAGQPLCQGQASGRNPRTARPSAAQIAYVEEGHRVFGRVLLGAAPAENNIFQPVFFSALSQIVPTVQAAGYLSPKPGNTFTYSPAPAVGGVLNDDPNDREAVDDTP